MRVCQVANDHIPHLNVNCWVGEREFEGDVEALRPRVESTAVDMEISQQSLFVVGVGVTIGNSLLDFGRER